MSQATINQPESRLNAHVTGENENRLINAGRYPPISNSSIAVSSPTQPPIRGSQSHQLVAANDRLEALLAAGRELRQEWADSEHWRQLAKRRGYRLPHWYLPMTPRGIEVVLRGLGLDRQFFREAFGLKTYKDLIRHNPRVPLWVFAGWCLELGNLPPSDKDTVFYD
jgi:hypothetical protein